MVTRRRFLSTAAAGAAMLSRMPHAVAATYDLIIKGGRVIDPSLGIDAVRDVAVAAGRIAAVAENVAGDATETIDARGLIVAPGFVDPHTHYDAQICWDPLLTSSSWHGVTSLVMGNCGVGIAPCKPAVREIAAWDLVNVEAIPFDVLSKGITWDWVSFPEFMDAAARRGLGINAGFLAPLTPMRHFAMGEESMERAATPRSARTPGPLPGHTLPRESHWSRTTCISSFRFRASGTWYTCSRGS